MQRQTIYFSGNVQGVGFRYGVQRSASGRAVTGFVRNLPDGRVELVIEGDPAELARLVADVQDRFAGNIRHLDRQASPATGEFAGFTIRR